MSPITIPDQLKKLPLRYGLLQGKEPPATERGWETINNFPAGHPTLERWMSIGWNYSVICGFANLIVVDSDTDSFTTYMDSKAPKTFTVKTRRGKHWYYVCPGFDNLNLKDKVGEVRAKSRYVVGPNSIHPDTRQPYAVIFDYDVTTLSAEELNRLLKEWKAYEVKDISPFDDPFFVPTQCPDLPEDQFIQYLNALCPYKCILYQNLRSAPSHTARVAFVAWLNFLHYSLEEAYQLIDKLAEFARWEDRANMGYRHYQIRTVISRGYKPYSCDKMIKEGWCVGKKCQMFRRG
jgi:hypothetical protein